MSQPSIALGTSRNFVSKQPETEGASLEPSGCEVLGDTVSLKLEFMEDWRLLKCSKRPKETSCCFLLLLRGCESFPPQFRVTFVFRTTDVH